jgi:hypothetical protein
MGIVVAVAAAAGFAFGGAGFGTGVIIGGVLAYVNYLWLDRSTRAIFADNTTASTTILAAKYILRYAVLGGVLFLIYMTGVIPVASVILGLSAFAVAVVIEGIKNIFTSSLG